MDASTYQITEKISKLYQEVYDAYLPLVEDGCGRGVSEDELSHFLDYLLDFPSCIKFYIEAYREMWEDEPLEFEGAQKQAGANAFTMSPKKWIEATSKLNYRIHTDAIKDNLNPSELTPAQVAYKFQMVIHDEGKWKNRVFLFGRKVPGDCVKQI